MDQAKDMYKLQKQAKQIKKELKNIHIEAEAEGVVLVVDGEQTFLEAKIPEALSGNTKHLEKAFVECANKAIKKSQAIAADKMKDMMGGMGGLFGGQQ